MTFARYMEMALYDPQYGYYMTARENVEGEKSQRIGWQGDFYTAPELSPLLARTLVQQVLEIDGHLGHPSAFVFVEMGAGTGTFARDFLQSCRTEAPALWSRLSYRIVERSPSLQVKQLEEIQRVIGSAESSRVHWLKSLADCPDDSMTGVFFSNELVDAFPVHRVKGTSSGLQEVLVDFADGRFVERLGGLSSSKVSDYVRQQNIVLDNGCTSELHVQAGEWMADVARVLHRGVVITVDYGHSASDFYRPDRKDGTLLCYYQHSVSQDPYDRIGEQDLTAHVNFSALANIGTRHQMFPVGFTTLANWLMGLGVDHLVAELDQESKEVRALAQLLHPHGMGKTFKVLVQQKYMANVSLKGLQFRAFFDDVL
ncbi:MAG: class I SAM-dependent methyltransferase [Nitrospirales bacterium]